ncbi:complement factor H-related protein 3-like isoform X2 [Pagrus major]|uniref:complement factor H-related protein 3-like isoform X2 n=1 Tax=Pagrus major TaxID=143350 RepID=UPI003CC85068
MCIRYLGLVLLIWCPGELHAQSATQSCSAPTLDGGKFSPKRETYANGVYVTYSCDLGRKPAVEGWWARSTCQNGTWSPQPQCILEEACIPPEIPNAKYTESPTGWYEDGQKIRITCDEAYELKNRDATALCTNGSWSSVPVCERSVDACGEPPQVLHAIIVDQRNQELFAADTELQYECEDGYTAEGAGNDKTIVCIAGAWTEGPTCSKAPTPSTGPGGSTEGGAGGEHTASAGSGTQPAGGGSSLACGEPPQVPHAVIVDHRYQELFAADTELQYECEDGYTAEGAGNDKTIACIAGAWTKSPTCSRVTAGSSGMGPGGGDTTSAGSGTPPAGRGSSSSSGSNTTDTERRLTTIGICGTPPKIQDAEVVRTLRRSVKYQCNRYYKRLGPESVRCYSDGTWSELPTCEASFCVVNTLEYPDLKPAGVKYIADGEDVRLECVDKWLFDNYSDGHCNNRIIHLSRCCTKAQLFLKCNGFLTKAN